MKVLVTGANGQVGFDVIRVLKEEHIDHLGTTRKSMDITDKDKVMKVICDYKPTIVIHCAAYTQVDKAEEEREICYKVNVSGTKHIAMACREINAIMMYISTDYVFDGTKVDPYETEDKPNPINYYGQTKYEGECQVSDILEKYFICRTSWVFGSHGHNFVKTMLRLSQTKDVIEVVNDQFGSPTYSYDLAEVLVAIIGTSEYGIYHVTNSGYCSWYDFACEIFRLSDIDVKVKAISSNEFRVKAKRPVYSRLSNEKLLKLDIVNSKLWKYGLKFFLETNSYDN